MVGEVKKQRYVYYHCTGYADKCQGNPASCRRRYVREEVLEQKFTELLARLRFDDEVLEWVRELLQASHADERREHEEVIRRLQAEHKRLGDRINAMYLDKLDGRVDGAFFDKMSAQWREQQNRCLGEIARHEFAEQSYLGEGVQIFELAQSAQKLFERQEARQKRRLLNFVLSNCTWEDGEVVATFRQPFDLLAETTAVAMRTAVDDKGNLAKSEIWLGRQDLNLGMAESKTLRFTSNISACSEKLVQSTGLPINGLAAISECPWPPSSTDRAPPGPLELLAAPRDVWHHARAPHDNLCDPDHIALTVPLR